MVFLEWASTGPKIIIAHVLHANENKGIRSKEGEEGRRERWGN
jgi:hypothetical protein